MGPQDRPRPPPPRDTAVVFVVPKAERHCANRSQTGRIDFYRRGRGRGSGSGIAHRRRSVSPARTSGSGPNGSRAGSPQNRDRKKRFVATRSRSVRHCSACVFPLLEQIRRVIDETLAVPICDQTPLRDGHEAFGRRFDGALAWTGGQGLEAGAGQVCPQTEHPVVATHPRAGPRFLRVDRAFTSHFVRPTPGRARRRPRIAVPPRRDRARLPGAGAPAAEFARELRQSGGPAPCGVGPFPVRAGRRTRLGGLGARPDRLTCGDRRGDPHHLGRRGSPPQATDHDGETAIHVGEGDAQGRSCRRAPDAHGGDLGPCEPDPIVAPSRAAVSAGVDRTAPRSACRFSAVDRNVVSRGRVQFGTIGLFKYYLFDRINIPQRNHRSASSVCHRRTTPHPHSEAR